MRRRTLTGAFGGFSLVNASRNAFERMAEVGRGDAGALARSLRHGVTDAALRALAAEAVHVAAAAPERMVEIYDAAAAGWLGRNIDLPPTSSLDPLTITAACWQTFWSIAAPPVGVRRQAYGQRMMEFAGELDPRINARVAAAAMSFPGVADAAATGLSPPHDFERLSQFPPASLGYALSQELLNPGSPASDAYWVSALPYLRHMPAPLGHINVEVIQSMALWSLVAGYTTRTLDRVALGGFLMAQVGHHYSALASAVTLTTAAVQPDDNLAVVLDCLFKGWAHGRATTPLIQVSWEPLWHLRVDQVRTALQIEAFESPYARGASEGWTPRVV